MESRLRFNALEAAILNWIAARLGDVELAAQLQAAQPTEREYTGCGCFTKIGVPAGLDAIPVAARNGDALRGPEISSRLLDHGACSVLFIVDGFVSLLEIAAYGEHFPEHLNNWMLHER